MRRWSLYTTIFAIICAIVLFLPELLSTTVGKRFFIHSIEEKTHTTATIQSLDLTWFGPQRIHHLEMTSPTFKGTIESLQIGTRLWRLTDAFKLENIDKLTGDLALDQGNFQFISETGQSVAIDNVAASLHSDRGAADFIASGQAQNGSFSLQGQAKGFYDFSVHATLKSFPLLPVARILADKKLADEKLVLEALGDTIDLSGSASMQQDSGLIDVSLQTPNVNGALQGTLTDKTLTLRGPLLATIKLTPTLSQTLLKDVNPLFLTGIQSKRPIQLRIESRGFECRLDLPFEVQHLKIGAGTLDLGQVRCQNGELLSALVALLKNNFFSSQQMMDVWFTPVGFSLQNGLLQTGRMDALAAGSIRFCTWGNIDLLRDSLNMTLGLTADTLKNTFGINNLPMEYVLTIPIKGRTKHPKLHAGAAAATIAALLASKKAPADLPGGLLQLFKKKESNVPPPNRPFPWES